MLQSTYISFSFLFLWVGFPLLLMKIISRRRIQWREIRTIFFFDVCDFGRFEEVFLYGMIVA